MQNPETDKPRDKPIHVFLNDKELKGMGFIRAPDGAVLDNRDGFYSTHRESFIRTYDCRTMVAVSKSLLFKLLEVYEEKLNAS